MLRKECKEMITSVDMNMVKSYLNLVDISLIEFRDSGQTEKLDTNDINNILMKIVIFSFVWSAGANLHDNVRENSRIKFSSNLRAKILKL